jgi:hypothetical protein
MSRSIFDFVQNFRDFKMASGGARKGAGRKPTSPNVKSREMAEKAFARGDRMPLEIMLDMMNGRAPYDKDLMALCQAAAPYLHPRLSAVEAKIDVGVSEMSDDDLDELIASTAGQVGIAAGLAGEGEEED